MGVNGSDVLVTDLDRQFILGVTHCEQLLLLKLIVQYVVVSAFSVTTTTLHTHKYISVPSALL